MTSDLVGWAAIAAMFYLGAVFACAIDDSCAAIWMGPLL